MKNVVIFSWAGERQAIELRWVREIVTLGDIAAVPGAPTCIAGATNLSGAIVPILLPGAPVRRPRSGDAAIVVEVGDVVAALATDSIGEVMTLRESPESGQLTDSAKRPVTTISPSQLIDSVIDAVAGARRPTRETSA